VWTGETAMPSTPKVPNPFSASYMAGQNRIPFGQPASDAYGKLRHAKQFGFLMVAFTLNENDSEQ
jgi:hypothetical protein